MKYTLKSTLLFLLCAMSFISCKKDIIMTEEGKKNSIGTLINNSGVNIKLIPYNKDRIVHAEIVSITADEQLEIANSLVYATGKGPGFAADIFAVSDSIQVVFDDKYLLTYSDFLDDTTLLSYQIPFSDDFNFLNIEKYYWWYEESAATLYHEFTFTPEHYAYAQENGMLVE